MQSTYLALQMHKISLCIAIILFILFTTSTLAMVDNETCLVESTATEPVHDRAKRQSAGKTV